MSERKEPIVESAYRARIESLERENAELRAAIGTPLDVAATLEAARVDRHYRALERIERMDFCEMCCASDVAREALEEGEKS